MNIDDIKLEWSNDCIINKHKLDDESIKSALLHSKYINYFIEFKLKYSKLKYDYNQLKINKSKYYKGELSKDELSLLGWQPYQFNKPIKSELERLLECDKNINDYKIKLEYIECCLLLLESILLSIKDRTWSIKNAISFRQFEAGN